MFHRLLELYIFKYLHIHLAQCQMDPMISQFGSSQPVQLVEAMEVEVAAEYQFQVHVQVMGQLHQTYWSQMIHQRLQL